MSVPFTIESVFQGFAETQGILSVDGTDLKLEFQTSDNILGLLKSGVREVRLPLDKVEEIRFRKWLFSCSIIIRMAEMRVASEVPNFKQGEIRLSISRKHRQAAEDLVAAVQVAPAVETK
jgi:hypothetical protein